MASFVFSRAAHIDDHGTLFNEFGEIYACAAK